MYCPTFLGHYKSLYSFFRGVQEYELDKYGNTGRPLSHINSDDYAVFGLYSLDMDVRGIYEYSETINEYPATRNGDKLSYSWDRQLSGELGTVRGVSNKSIQFECISSKQKNLINYQDVEDSSDKEKETVINDFA